MIAREDSGADDRPITVTAVTEFVDVGGEVRSVKAADAEVHDAPSEPPAVVAGDGNRGFELIEVGSGERNGVVIERHEIAA
jgi:hypothetical protein